MSFSSPAGHQVGPATLIPVACACLCVATWTNGVHPQSPRSLDGSKNSPAFCVAHVDIASCAAVPECSEEVKQQRVEAEQAQKELYAHRRRRRARQQRAWQADVASLLASIPAPGGNQVQSSYEGIMPGTVRGHSL